jgi:glycosyltransferase involved in cell wall biosynthesis
VFSRLVPEKRINDVIAAARNLGSRCDLIIAGTGPELDRLRKVAGDLPHVRFLGHVRPPRLWSLVASATVCVAASELEGLPLAMLEALALGTPVVASDIPSHREIVGPDFARGLLFPTGDVAHLRQRLFAVLDNPVSFAQTAADLRRSVLERFGHITTIDETEKALIRALARKRCPMQATAPI